MGTTRSDLPHVAALPPQVQSLVVAAMISRWNAVEPSLTLGPSYVATITEMLEAVLATLEWQGLEIRVPATDSVERAPSVLAHINVSIEGRGMVFGRLPDTLAVDTAPHGSATLLACSDGVVRWQR